uniref:Terpene synthase metal-binding domain-containing protein n=1 Tax=Kalanchoe fedtschenkoi TaxID=63787 RepID=A0A7N0V7D1_KALFE
MGNAWISICIPLFAMQALGVKAEQVTLTELKCLENDADFMKSAGIIARLVDDLGTSSDEMARGDVPKAIQFYMNDTGASEEAARNHVKDMVREEWKKLNKYAMENKTLLHSTVEMIPNLLKGAHFFYMYGDGYGIRDKETEVTMSKLLFDPIPASDAE